MTPDVCLCNWYPPAGGKLGLHQDRSEGQESLKRGAPVVSISVGDAAEFVFSERGPEDPGARAVLLESGDALVFGGAARLMHHGVRTVVRGTAPRGLCESTGLVPGRLNLTFRQL